MPGQDQRACCAPLTRAPISEGEAAEVAHVLKALADPVRLRLLSLIGAHEAGDACVCDLTVAFDLTASSGCATTSRSSRNIAIRAIACIPCECKKCVYFARSWM